MSWKRLDIDDLRLVLAEDEVQKLNEASLDPGLSAVVQEQLDMVSDAFRGAFLAKGYSVDSRDHYTPSSYRAFVLNYARFQIFTRFPMTPDYALDENRKKQYEEAVDMMKNPVVGVDPRDPDDPGLEDDAGKDPGGGAVTMPWQKFPAYPFDEGFAQVWPFGRTAL